MKESIAAILTSIAIVSFGCSDTPSAPKVSDRELEKAIELVKARDFAGAVVILNEVTKNQPDNARAWSLLGMALHSMGFLGHCPPTSRQPSFPRPRRMPCTTQRAPTL